MFSPEGPHGRLESSDLWPAMAAVEDPKDIVDLVGALTGLQAPSALGEETAEVVVYRFIAEFL